MNSAGTLELLSEVNNIIEAQDVLAHNTGCNYNIFDIAQIGTDERRICRVLTDLLSPDGYHGQKGLFLNLFLCHLLSVNLDMNIINKAQVITERYTDEGRPVDIVIDICGKIIPIEVKIYAGDQKSQCYDYYIDSAKKDPATKIVYITPDGRMPSENSRRGQNGEWLPDEKIKCLSFENDITMWLSECLKLTDIEKKLPIYEVLKQLISTIEFNMKEGDKTVKAVSDYISETPQRIRNAKTVIDALDKCKKDKLKEYYEAIEAGLKGDNRIKRVYLNNEEEYTIKENLSNAYPAINYQVRHIAELGVDVFFIIVLNGGSPICGYGTINRVDNNKRGNKCIELLKCEPVSSIFNNDLLEKVRQRKINSTQYFFAYDYFYYNGDKIDFLHYNDNFSKLFDNDEFARIVNSSVEQARKMLDFLAADKI